MKEPIPITIEAEIIETYWNVNVLNTFTISVADFEIIETYWNVNSNAIIFSICREFEIIETYWNVNESVTTTTSGNR